MSSMWPYVLLTAVAGALGVTGRSLLRAHRTARRADEEWRAEDRRASGRRSLGSVDAMSWQEFERYVAGLCRRDGCTDVVVSGKPGDLGADVVGRMPDGRLLVVQCKHYAPHRRIPSADMQKFIGTVRLHHGADVAVFAATCFFTKDALNLAVRHDVLAVHRDLLGQWNTGTPLEVLPRLNGAGQGDRAHQRRRRSTYEP